jgi:hypothetical protein
VRSRSESSDVGKIQILRDKKKFRPLSCLPYDLVRLSYQPFVRDGIQIMTVLGQHLSSRQVLRDLERGDVRLR